jgi:hypothetical protein
MYLNSLCTDARLQRAFFGYPDGGLIVTYWEQEIEFPTAGLDTVPGRQALNLYLWVSELQV